MVWRSVHEAALSRRRDDFFMGVELTMAAISSEMIFLIDAFQRWRLPSDTGTGQQLLGMSVALFLSFVFLMILLAVHQTYTRPNTRAVVQYFALTMMSNIVGVVAILIFVGANEWGKR